jgi:hypothetical protein
MRREQRAHASMRAGTWYRDVGLTWGACTIVLVAAIQWSWPCAEDLLPIPMMLIVLMGQGAWG